MRKFVLLGLLVSLALAMLLSPFASGFPDGLEWVAEKIGFLGRASEESVIPGPLPDYSVGGVKHEGFSTALAGLIGVLATFAVAWSLGRLLGGKRAG